MEIYSEQFVNGYIYETNKKHFRLIKGLKIEEFERMGINKSRVRNTNIHLLFVTFMELHYPIGFYVEGVGNSYHIHTDFIGVVQSQSAHDFDRLIEHGIKISSGMISAFVSKTSTRTMIETTLSSLTNTIEVERKAKFCTEPSPFLDDITGKLQELNGTVLELPVDEASYLYDEGFILFKHMAENGQVAKIMFYTVEKEYLIGYRVAGSCYIRNDIASNKTAFMNGKAQPHVIMQIIASDIKRCTNDMNFLERLIDRLVRKNDTPVAKLKATVDTNELPGQESELTVTKMIDDSKSNLIYGLIGDVEKDFVASQKKHDLLIHLSKVMSLLFELEK